MIDQPEIKTDDVGLQLAPVLGGLDIQTAAGLRDSFAGHFKQIKPLIEQAASLPKITDGTQVAQMKIARTLRLALKDVRLDADKTRKKLKEDALRYGKAVDGINNVLLFAITPVEKMLQEQEDFVEKQEELRKAKLIEVRSHELASINVDSKFYQLGEMPEEAYQQLFKTNHTAYLAWVDAQKKLEEQRIAAKQAEEARIEAQRIENEALKKAAMDAEQKAIAAANEQIKKDEAVAMERQAAVLEAQLLRAIVANAEKKEREAQAARVEQVRQYEAKQKEEREKLEAERKALADEAHRLEVQKAAQTKNQTAVSTGVANVNDIPDSDAGNDRTKAESIVKVLKQLSVQIPSFHTVAGSTIGANVSGGLAQLIEYIETEIKNLP